MAKPYVFINDQMQTYATLKAKLGISGNASTKFDMLNAHIRNAVVMPGHFVIVGDDSTRSCTGEEVELMTLAGHVRNGVVNNSTGGDGYLVKNYDLLQKLLGYGSIGVGASTGAWSNHLLGVKETLKEIEALHKQYLGKNGQLARNEFIYKRKILFGALEVQLEGIAHYGTGLQNKGSIKKMLGISTKSYMHTGEISGYAKTITGVARASKHLKGGTLIGITLDVGSTAININEVCTIERETECTKAMYVDGSKLIGSVSGSTYGGSLGATAGIATCMIVFGIPTGGLGALGCGILGGVGGAVLGGGGGGLIGESIGNLLYNTIEE